MPCTTPSLEQFRLWLAPVSTFFAVIVALFAESWRRKYRRPKLRVQLECKRPDCIQLGNCAYYRIRILNDGRTTAEGVQVYAKQIDPKSDGKPSKFIPMNLKWSNTGEVIAAGIPPKMHRYCDVVVVKKSTSSGQPQGAVAALVTEVDPDTGNSVIEPGTYYLQLLIGASNVKTPVHRQIEINHTGKWFDKEEDMLFQGTSVTLSST